MISILIWVIFGLLTGALAKFLHPGDDPVGFLPTVGIGICGSFIGGAINWALDAGKATFEPSGFFMSIIGGVVFCAIWRFYKLKNGKDGPRNFVTGKKING